MIGVPTVPVWPQIIAKGGVKTAVKLKRAVRIAGYAGLAGAFIYGMLRVRALVRKSKKNKAEKQQQKQIAEMYAEMKKQKQR